MILDIRFWIHSPDLPVNHGYTPGDEDNAATLRLGPLIIAWELVE